ncbi:MAG: hypothetical protein ACRDPB_05460 [Nocardioidaceae bacterium]
MSRRLLVLLLAVVLGAAAGCARTTGTVPDSSVSTGSTPPPDASSSLHVQAASIHADDPYAGLAEKLHARGVQVWYEADLVKAWLQGPTAFGAAVARLGGLAREPGVVGFKVADELGYHDGLQSPEQTLQFLRDSHRALAAVAPGKQVLVDMVVTELGCLPWTSAGASCAASARSAAPAATIAATTAYLRSGYIDRLDLSSGLLDAATYQDRGLSLDQAQRDVWAHVVSLGWQKMTHLQARKALAEAGGYAGTATQAAADVATYVTTPVAAGAGAVDIWTWRQPYQGQTVSLLAPDLSANPLWVALSAAHRDGVHLITHMTPSAMPTSGRALAHECDVASGVFDAVFVAAGTG